MIRGALNRMIWGYIIVLLDITVGPLDLFYDVFGYILIVNGLRKFQHQPAFQYAKVGFIIVACYSVVAIFFPPQANLLADTVYINRPMFLSFIEGLMQVITLFANANLMYGLVEILRKRGWLTKGKSLNRFRVYFIIVTLISIVSNQLSLIMIEWIVPFSFVLLFVLILTHIILMLHLHRLRPLLEPSLLK